MRVPFLRAQCEMVNASAPLSTGEFTNPSLLLSEGPAQPSHPLHLEKSDDVTGPGARLWLTSNLGPLPGTV